MNYKIFIINLDSSTDRWSKVKSQLDHYQLNYERVSAIDGRTASPEVLKKYSLSKNKYKYHTILSKGEIACYLSHIKCWQKIVDEKLDFAIILEDDVKLLRDFNELNDLLSNASFPEWDYIKIGENPITRKNKNIININNSRVFTYDKVPTRACAQIISFEGAKKLLANSKSIYRPVDVDIQYVWENKLKVIGIKPYFVEALVEQSDINEVGGRRKKKSFFVKLINIVQEKTAKFIYELKN